MPLIASATFLTVASLVASSLFTVALPASFSPAFLSLFTVMSPVLPSKSFDESMLKVKLEPSCSTFTPFPPCNVNVLPALINSLLSDLPFDTTKPALLIASTTFLTIATWLSFASSAFTSPFVSFEATVILPDKTDTPPSLTLRTLLSIVSFLTLKVTFAPLVPFAVTVEVVPFPSTKLTLPFGKIFLTS